MTPLEGRIKILAESLALQWVGWLSSILGDGGDYFNICTWLHLTPGSPQAQRDCHQPGRTWQHGGWWLPFCLLSSRGDGDFDDRRYHRDRVFTGVIQPQIHYCRNKLRKIKLTSLNKTFQSREEIREYLVKQPIRVRFTYKHTEKTVSVNVKRLLIGVV